MLDVALEVPLPLLTLGRLLQRHDARAAWIEVLHEALDGATLARRVAALEQNDDLLLGLLDPTLRLEQLDLQLGLVLLVGPPRDPRLVGVLAGLEEPPDRRRVALQPSQLLPHRCRVSARVVGQLLRLGA